MRRVHVGVTNRHLAAAQVPCDPKYESGSTLGGLRRSVFFWALFIAGLLLQVSGPHLKIKNNRFILPPSLVSADREIRPDAIVERERERQLLSGLLTVGGTIGLALYHRKALFARRSSQRDLVNGNSEDSTRMLNL
jgi:hypothetical protein